MAKIVAIVVRDKNQVDGGAPIFITHSIEEQKKIAFSLEKMMDASAHELENGIYILIEHNDGNA